VSGVVAIGEIDVFADKSHAAIDHDKMAPARVHAAKAGRAFGIAT
jgi:hypothetical protein